MPFTIGGDWSAPEPPKKPKPKRPVKVRSEKRGNKRVTVVLNLPFEDEEIKTLAKKLKRHCSCGGTIKAGVIELQGEKVEEVQQFLRNEGIKAQ